MKNAITISQTTTLQIGVPPIEGKTKIGVYDAETAKRVMKEYPDAEIFATNENNTILGQITTDKEADCIFRHELIGLKRKSREDYKCYSCGGTINKGEYYDDASGMTATYKDENGESRRDYFQFRMHLHNCYDPVECQKGNHDFQFREQKGNPNDDWAFEYVKGGYFCINCFKEKEPEI